MKTREKLSRFERLMTAITFAEAGEFDTAREFLKEDRPQAQRAVKKQDRQVKRA